jgi:hypothetical protein
MSLQDFTSLPVEQFIQKTRQEQVYYLQYDLPEVTYTDLTPDGLHIYNNPRTGQRHYCHYMGGRWRWF